MKSIIAILALLGVASATFYGLYPEQQHFWGPYRYPVGETSFPWYNYKYGQSLPLTQKSIYPYSKYFHSYPYTTYPYGKEYVPEYIQGQYPVKDVTFYKHITTVPGFDKKHELPYYFPYGQEKMYNPVDKFVPFYMKYLPKYHEKFVPEYEKFVPEYEKFVPQYEKFMPTYGSEMPLFSKYMPSYEKFLPEFEKFMPFYEKFMPTWFQKYWPKYEKFVPETVYPVEQTLETEAFVNTPRVHDAVYPTYPTQTPYWNKFFGHKSFPYEYPTSQYYPKYFEQRPFHFGLY